MCIRDRDEALALARELKDQAHVASTLEAQGDNQFYRGDMKAALALYTQARQEACLLYTSTEPQTCQGSPLRITYDSLLDTWRANPILYGSLLKKTGYDLNGI